MRLKKFVKRIDYIYASISLKSLEYKVHAMIIKRLQVNLLKLEKFTEDGSVKALPQILYGQHLILEAFGMYNFICFRPINQSFLLKREPAILSHGQWTHCAKVELIVWPEIPQMSHKISAHFVCPSPKVSNF